MGQFIKLSANSHLLPLNSFPCLFCVKYKKKYLKVLRRERRKTTTFAFSSLTMFTQRLQNTKSDVLVFSRSCLSTIFAQGFYSQGKIEKFSGRFYKHWMSVRSYWTFLCLQYLLLSPVVYIEIREPEKTLKRLNTGKGRKYFNFVFISNEEN